MHWVWNHSRSRGNARLALLFVADQVRTSACEVRLSYADFTAALNASRSVAKAAVKAAAETGELQIIEQGKGTRPSLYSLPKAVGFVRPSTSSGPESGPLATREDRSSGPELSPLDTNHDRASGPESGPEWAGIRPSSGPESGPHSPFPSPSKQEGEPESQQPDDYGIPADVRPLMDSMYASGVNVRWPFVGNQWFPVIALIKKCGIPALVDHARRTADRTSVDSAKYFMRGWGELPPKPADGDPVYTARPRTGRRTPPANSSPHDEWMYG